MRDYRALVHAVELKRGSVIAIAEARYLAMERQLTNLLVLQHELGLFLQVSSSNVHCDCAAHNDDIAVVPRLVFMI